MYVVGKAHHVWSISVFEMVTHWYVEVNVSLQQQQYIFVAQEKYFQWLTLPGLCFLNCFISRDTDKLTDVSSETFPT